MVVIIKVVIVVILLITSSHLSLLEVMLTTWGKARPYLMDGKYIDYIASLIPYHADMANRSSIYSVLQA